MVFGGYCSHFVPTFLGKTPVVGLEFGHKLRMPSTVLLICITTELRGMARPRGRLQNSCACSDRRRTTTVQPDRALSAGRHGAPYTVHRVLKSTNANDGVERRRCSFSRRGTMDESDCGYLRARGTHGPNLAARMASRQKFRICCNSVLWRSESKTIYRPSSRNSYLGRLPTLKRADSRRMHRN